MGAPELESSGTAEPPDDEGGALERPLWLTVLRRALAIALLPIALALVAWPWVVFGGYRLEWMPDGAMAPTMPAGKIILASARGARAIRTGAVYGYLTHAPDDSVRYRRVLARAGESVSIGPDGLTRNGEQVAEPYARGEVRISFPPMTAPSAGSLPYSLPDGSEAVVTIRGGEAVIPEGWCFVLPDSRRYVSGSEPLLVPEGDIVSQLAGRGSTP